MWPASLLALDGRDRAIDAVHGEQARRLNGIEKRARPPSAERKRHAGIREEAGKLRILLNQLAALGKRTGVGHYAAQLLAALLKHAGPEESVDCYPNGWFRHIREAVIRIRQGKSNGAGRAIRAGLSGPVRHLSRMITAGHFRLATSVRSYDLYHEPNFIPLPCDIPAVATLHDLSALVHPEWHPADRVRYFEKHFDQGLARSIHLVTVSDFCRQEVLDILHLPPDRVTRIYQGIRPGLMPIAQDEVAGVLKRLGLTEQYLLYVGTIEPRKNILTLLHAYCALPAAIRESWPLLLVGGWGWNTGEVADYLEREARHRGVVHLGYLADEHLPAVYNGARALLYPSLYEGFGLPPLEMMACGGAVIASTAGSLRETVGGRAHLVEPHDTDGWRTAMARVVTDREWWQSLRTGVIGVARSYTWDRCAIETLKLYRRLHGASEAPATLPLPSSVQRAAG
jgi:alpha-1,3-rhamnosyl/mannosyltransferase